MTMGYGYQAVRRGRRGVLAGMLLGLTCVCHFIYGWIAAVTLCLLALLPDAEVGRWLRIRRTVLVGLVAMVLSAFQLLPVWMDRAIAPLLGKLSERFNETVLFCLYLPVQRALSFVARADQNRRDRGPL